MAWRRPYQSAKYRWNERENSHQVLAGDLGDLAVLEELSVVVESHEDTSGRPRELVTEGVVGSL
jgi:hypothetical protein